MTYEAIGIEKQFEKAISFNRAELQKKYIKSKNEQRKMFFIAYDRLASSTWNNVETVATFTN